MRATLGRACVSQLKRENPNLSLSENRNNTK